MKAEVRIEQWGNCVGLRLPARIANAASLQNDQRVCLSIEQGRIIITPVESQPVPLGERLARFDPERHGGEAMATEPREAETW